MPPKRKRDTEDAATEEPKKLTKAEKAKKKQEQILKAKKWAEERQKAKLAKQNGASTAAAKETPVKKTPVKKTPAKKRSTTARTPKSTRSTRKKPVVEEVQEEEEEAPKPRTKRRKLSSTEEESTPAVQEKTESPAKINIQQPVTSPAAIHVKQSDGSDLVYVPVETAAQNVSSSAVSAPVPAPVPLSVPSPEKPIVQETEEKSPVKKTVLESTQAPVETNVATTVEVVEEESEESTESKKPSLALAFLKNFVMCTGIALAVGFVLLSLSLYIFDSENSSSNGTISSTTTPDVASSALCFDNHGFGEESESGVSCENPVPCPEFGMCQGGSLVKCLDYDFEWDGDFYIPSEKKNDCVIAPDAMESLLGLHKTLTDLTVEHVCRSNFGVGTVCRVSKENIFVNGTTLFKLDAVAEIAELTQSQVLLLLEKMDSSDIVQKVITQDGVDIEFIGMSEEFVAKKLPVQTSCWIRMLIWDILVYTATFVYGFVKVLATLAWSIASANPLPTAVVAIITYALLWVQNKRSKVASLRKQAAEIQNIAYDKLIMDCNEGEGYASLHLRDEIAHEKYPEPGAERQYFINNVWPRTLALIRADNRVTKSRKSIGGKSLEWLEWVSDSSRKSRRSLAAANSSNEGENKTKIE